MSVRAIANLPSILVSYLQQPRYPDTPRCLSAHPSANGKPAQAFIHFNLRCSPTLIKSCPYSLPMHADSSSMHPTVPKADRCPCIWLRQLADVCQCYSSSANAFAVSCSRSQVPEDIRRARSTPSISCIFVHPARQLADGAWRVLPIPHTPAELTAGHASI